MGEVWSCNGTFSIVSAELMPLSAISTSSPNAFMPLIRWRAMRRA